jgi:hypothetical protein
VLSRRSEGNQPGTSGETRNKDIHSEETQMTNRSIAKEAKTPGPLTTRKVAEEWFSNLEQGDVQGAQALLDESVVWEAAFLGKHSMTTITTSPLLNRCILLLCLLSPVTAGVAQAVSTRDGRPEEGIGTHSVLAAQPDRDGGGEQIAVTQFHTYDHRWISSVRFPF